MSLSYREKQMFFTQLAQLLRAGLGLPAAVEKLSRLSNTAIRDTSRRLRKLLDSDRTAAEAFDALRPQLGALERNSLSALARSGRLEFGLERLAEYFGVLSSARLEMLSRSAYPLVVLHFGVLVLNLPSALSPAGGLKFYLKETGTIFLIGYSVAAAFVLLLPLLQSAAASSGFLDGLLRDVPFFGKARRALATSRFCSTLDLQLDAGINVIESLQCAAEASRSGLLHGAARRGTKMIRAGKGISEVLASSGGALPALALDRIIIAEETGELHRVLPELAKEYGDEGLRRLRTASVWIPNLLYFGVLGFIGYKIIQFYMGYFKQLEGVLNM